MRGLDGPAPLIVQQSNAAGAEIDHALFALRMPDIFKRPDLAVKGTDRFEQVKMGIGIIPDTPLQDVACFNFGKLAIKLGKAF